MFTVIKDDDSSSQPSDIDTSDILQQLHDVTIKLEFAQQDNGVIVLEKIELEKEINELKLRIEQLTEENEHHVESSQREQQKISFLRTVSMNMDEVNSYNDDLNTHIISHQNIIKKLKKKNINIQKENENLKIILEQIEKKKEKQDEIYMNNTTKLKNQIKELQNECIELRKEINIFETTETCSNSDSCSEEKDLFEPQQKEKKYSDNKDVFKVRNSSLNDNDLMNVKALFSEFGYGNNSDSEHNETEIHNHGIMEFHELVSVASVISEGTERSQRGFISKMDCNKCSQYIAEIDKLNMINKENKRMMKSLQKKNKKLNEALGDKKIGACSLFSWFK